MTDQAQNKPKLEIRVIPTTPLQQNTSLIWSIESKEGVFVDPGGDIDKLMAAAPSYESSLRPCVRSAVEGEVEGWGNEVWEGIEGVNSRVRCGLSPR